MRLPPKIHPLAEHPRARGENRARRCLASCWAGTSPRTRGKRRCNRIRGAEGRNIPAHAGKTSCPQSRGSLGQEHPRARGENSHAGGTGLVVLGTSPRTRGKPPGLAVLGAGVRNIPAHAGKTVQQPPCYIARKEHPRARGENEFFARNRFTINGTSPRTRGKLTRVESLVVVKRNIPAHAGKTGGEEDSNRTHPEHPRARGENAKSLTVKR